MKTTNEFKVRHKILFFIIVFSMIPLFFVSRTVIIGFSQVKNKDEKEIKKISFENEPIEFIEIESDSKIVLLDEKFVQKDDWLKDFTIKFKNISDKPIIYVSIAIDFPETESTGKAMVYFLKYGVSPAVSKSNNSKNEALLPGNTAEIKLSAEQFSKLKNFLAPRSSLAGLTKANFRIMVVNFDGGMKWSAGTMFRPDESQPGKFIAIEKENNIQP